MNQNSNSRKPLVSQSSHYSGRDYYKDNLRVLRKNLLFCSGLPLSLTQQQIRSTQYFGKYGKVTKVIMLKNLRQMSVYVTYSDVYEASLAIIATNDFQIDRYHKLASIYGTIKYCKYFLKKIQCKNIPNCNYLHVYDKKNQIYIDNQLPDEVFEEHYRIAYRLLKEVNLNKLAKEKNLLANTVDDILPCPLEAIKRLNKEKLPGSSKYIEVTNEQNSEQSYNSPYSSSQSQQDGDYSQNQDEKSEQQTSQTIVIVQKQQPLSSNIHSKQLHQQQDPLKQQFPKLSISQPLIQRQLINRPSSSIKLQKQKQKSLLLQKKQSSTKPFYQKYQKQKSQKQKQKSQKKNQSLQIKLIRKLIRQPKSKLNNWIDYQKNEEQKQQINLFHRQLSELNELKQICENNILKEINKQEQRLKFLLIKNIHHKKHHHHHNNHHWNNNMNQHHHENMNMNMNMNNEKLAGGKQLKQINH